MQPDPEPVRRHKCGRLPRIIMHVNGAALELRFVRLQCACRLDPIWSDQMPTAADARRDGVHKWNKVMEAARG